MTAVAIIKIRIITVNIIIFIQKHRKKSEDNKCPFY